LLHGDHITLQIGDRVRYEIRGDECHEVTAAGRKRVSVHYALLRHSRYMRTNQTTVMERKREQYITLAILSAFGAIVTAFLLLEWFR
jgi:plastocyanin